LEGLSLEFQGARTWLLLGLPVIALMVVWWTYHRTYPPVERWYRWLLLTLRSAVVVLVGLLVFEPVLKVSRHLVRPERVAVLLDRSASMLLPADGRGGDGSPSRLDRMRELVHGAQGENRLSLFSFGAELKSLELPDSLEQGVEDRTNLATALDELRLRGAKDWDRIYVISDGCINAGADPVYSAEGLAPLEAVVVGAAPQVPDLGLSSLEQSRPAFAGGKIDLEFSVAVYLPESGDKNYPQGSVCDFFLDSRKIGEERIELGAGPARFVARTVSLPAPDAGVYWLRAIIRRLEGEWTTLNNERLIKVQVSRSKRKMLLVSNSPDWDFTFLRRLLSLNDDWDAGALLVLKSEDGRDFIRGQDSAGRFSVRSLPGPAELEDVELVLLHGELGRFGRSFLISLAERAKGGGFALVFWPAGELNTGKLPEELSGYLPFSDRQATLVQLKAPDVPSVLFTLDRYNILTGLGQGSQFADLPPVEWVYRSLPLKYSVAVLARTGGSAAPGGQAEEKGEVLLTAYPVGGTHVATVLAQGLWRWHMLSQDASDRRDKRYHRFWEALTEWLLSGEKGEELVLRPRRNVFQRGEKVVLEGAVAVKEAAGQQKDSITVTVWKENEKGERDTVTLVSLRPEEGRLSAEPGLLPPGVYSYQGILHSADSPQIAGGVFAVEGYSPEMALVAPDTSILARLARTSGGKIDADLTGQAQITAGDKEEIVGTSSRLAFSVLIYFFLIFLLAAEWTLRKIKALP